MAQSEKTAVENKVRRWAEQNGYFCFKLTPMGMIGLPDHFFFGEFPNLVIMEFKRPGLGTPTGRSWKHQKRYIEMLRKLK